MVDTLLLEKEGPITLEDLKANFRANDFSAVVPGYDSDRASSQDNHFYKRLQEHFAKVWNQQMGQLTSRKSLRNFSSNHPVRRLEESEAKLVSGMVMEILDDEQLCQAIMEATLVTSRKRSSRNCWKPWRARTAPRPYPKPSP